LGTKTRKNFTHGSDPLFEHRVFDLYKEGYPHGAPPIDRGRWWVWGRCETINSCGRGWSGVGLCETDLVFHTRPQKNVDK